MKLLKTCGWALIVLLAVVCVWFMPPTCGA